MPNKGKSSILKEWVLLFRPAQQLKQVFVFAPGIYAVNSINLATILNLVAAAIFFGLISTVVYCQNDLYDVKKNIKFPEIMDRPILRRIFSDKTIRFTQLLLLILSSFIIPIIENWEMIFLLGGLYLSINLLYTYFNLKKFELLGLICVVSGYPIRFQIGILTLGQPLSIWGLCIVTLLATSLFFGKKTRRAMNLNNQKAILDLRLSLYSSLTLTTCAYLIFSSSSDLTENWNQNFVMVSTLPFFLSLLRYAKMASSNETTGLLKLDINDNLIRDEQLIALATIWFAIMICARLMN